MTVWAKEILESADRLVSQARALQGDASRVTVRLSASYTIAEYLLPTALTELRLSSPKLELSLMVSNSAAVVDDVIGGRSQLGFIEGRAVPRGVRYRTIGNDRLAVICATNNPVGEPRRLQPDELVHHTIVLREPGSGTREVFLRALESAGVDLPRSVIEIGSTAAIMHATAASDMVGVVSELAIREGDHRKSVREVRVAGLDLRRALRAIWTPQHGRTVADVVTAAVRVGRRLNSAAKDEDDPVCVRGG
jgi:DNA-binding transcriptional LysR family regulator